MSEAVYEGTERRVPGKTRDVRLVKQCMREQREESLEGHGMSDEFQVNIGLLQGRARSPARVIIAMGLLIS